MLAKLRLVLVACHSWPSLGSVAPRRRPADFYKGKTIDMMIGYSVGGGYDVYARTDRAPSSASTFPAIRR